MTSYKTSIRNVLKNDATYLSLIGSPTDTPWNTFYKYPPQEPSYPFVVFWFRPGVVNTDFERSLIVEETEVNFNIWDQDNNYEDLAERIIFLLHHAASEALGFRLILSRQPQELYDQEMNAWALNIAFRLISGRSII